MPCCEKCVLDGMRELARSACAQMEEVQAVPTPTRSESLPPPSKIAKVSQLVVVRGPRPPPPVRASDQNCHLYIYKVITEAGYLWD